MLKKLCVTDVTVLCCSFHPVIKSYSTCILWAERINKKNPLRALALDAWPLESALAVRDQFRPFKNPDSDLI